MSILHIEAIMKKKGVGATELAKRLNVNRMTIYYYLKQDDRNSIAQLQKISDALGVPISDLFEQPASDTFRCPNCGTVLKVDERK